MFCRYLKAIYNINQQYDLRITDALDIKLEEELPKVNHKRFERIMRKNGIQARPKHKSISVQNKIGGNSYDLV